MEDLKNLEVVIKLPREKECFVSNLVGASKSLSSQGNLVEEIET